MKLMNGLNLTTEICCLAKGLAKQFLKPSAVECGREISFSTPCRVWRLFGVAASFLSKPLSSIRVAECAYLAIKALFSGLQKVRLQQCGLDST